MNWEQVKAIAWLRWRLSVNQWRRGGTINAVITMIIAAAALMASVCCFFVAITLGVLLLRKANADRLLVMWDVIVVVFLFLWIVGLFSELQRSEALSLEKLLHLPVSLSGAFLLNYLASLLSISLLIFIPVTAGLAIALVVVHGPRMLVVLPLLGSFVLMITAVTHQFRGWLFALMTNKRRRRTIIAAVTAVFILLVQLPNIVNLTVQRQLRSKGPDRYQVAIRQLHEQAARGEITANELELREKELGAQREQFLSQQRVNRLRSGLKIAKVMSIALPIGWLPYGVYGAANGVLWPGVLGVLFHGAPDG